MAGAPPTPGMGMPAVAGAAPGGLAPPDIGIPAGEAPPPGMGMPAVPGAPPDVGAPAGDGADPALGGDGAPGGAGADDELLAVVVEPLSPPHPTRNTSDAASPTESVRRMKSPRENDSFCLPEIIADWPPHVEQEAAAYPLG